MLKCLLTAGWLLYGVMGSKYLECNSSIRTEHILNNRTLNQTKALNEQKSNNKTSNKQRRHRIVDCFS
jgi:hypothetical protein